MSGITISQNTICTGCMACKAVCPMHCIDEASDEEGFIYPSINEDKCIKCGKCTSVCSGMNICRDEFDYEYAYAICAEDEIRHKSSSGGAFTLIANYILDKQGVICGAAFVGDEVRHIVIDNKKDLDRLRGSKYVQSNTTDIYTSIEMYLKQSRFVLFSGTACQCEAVKNCFTEFLDRLYLVDVLCMGVPSPQLLSEYIRDELGTNCSNINFRDKKIEGWSQNHYLSFVDSNNTKHYINYRNSAYFSAFLDAYSLRKSCFKCQYTGKRHPSDISIGDFWQCGEYDSTLDDGKGTSLILVSSLKGEQIIEYIRENCELIKKVPIDVAMRGNSVLIKRQSDNGRRKEFFRKLKELSLKDAINHMNGNSAQCGIINYWNSDDNGAILTAYALQQSLLKLGYSSRLIDLDNSTIPKEISDDFANKYLSVTSPIRTDEEYKKLNHSFENFLVGSDQVFRAEWVTNHWFLDFVDESKNKIAISASFGKDRINIPKERELEIRYLLSRFNSISIREIKGTILAKKLSGRKTFNIIDPVFWLKKDEYISSFNLQVDSNEKDIFVYIRDWDERKKSFCDKLAEKMKCSIFFATDSTGVERFVEKIANSKLVITDSYHGLCFSLIFNKNYKCIINYMRGADRFDSLIEVLRLNDKNFVSEKCLDIELNDIEDKNDWDTINTLIQEQRGIALDWIKEAIENKKDVRKMNCFVKRAHYFVYKFFNDLKLLIVSRLFFLKYCIRRPDYNEKVVLFGAGGYGRKAINIYNGRIAFFIDNSKKRWMNGYPVFSLKSAKKIMKEETRIIVTTSFRYQEEIIEQLENEGFKNIDMYEG